MYHVPVFTDEPINWSALQKTVDKNCNPRRDAITLATEIKRWRHIFGIDFEHKSVIKERRKQYNGRYLYTENYIALD